MKLTKFDYEFLTGTWGGVHGAAYNAVAEDCREAGLYRGWPPYPQLTEKGRKAVEEYENEP